MADSRLEKITNLILAFAQGRLNERIEIGEETDELEAISIGLNMLGEELYSTKKELLIREKKIQETLDQTQAAYKDLDQFAYIVSHDLQEPLRMVTSFLQLLQIKNKDKLDENSKQYIHYAVDGAERMKILINDILQYSRIGANATAFSATDLNEVVTDVLTVLDNKISEKNAAIVVHKLPVANANKTLIHQLFLNLITNALKYQNEAIPKVEIGCTDEKEEWVISVKDNGIGIDPRHFEKIFDMFQRLHTKKEYSGTGIGLAICKKVVQAHKGQIWLDSEPGKGSSFYFTIPKCAL